MYIFRGLVLGDKVCEYLFRVPMEEGRKVYISTKTGRILPASKSKLRNAYSMALLLLFGALPVFL